MELCGVPIIEIVLNPVILILILTFVIALVVIIERLLFLRKVKFNRIAFIDRIKASLKGEGVDKAVQVCKNAGHPLANVIGDGLKNASLGREDVYDALEEAQARERGKIEARVGILSTIAFIAPLLGLLGTVLGIIQAFSGMAAAGGADPTAMMSGVAVALVTTAVGIIIAVPAAIAYGVFSGRVDGIASEFEMASKELVVAISENIWNKN
jgi:biopolymer transport protein ExbB